jgi:hypothetical protein
LNDLGDGPQGWAPRQIVSNPVPARLP